MKFSIIVPIYNVELYLKECIESLLIQDFNNYEIILINDGSTDKSLNICKLYKDNAKVKIIDKVNSGLSDARNVGIRMACGDYIILVDSDDSIEKNFLSLLSKKIELSNPHVIICNFICYDDLTKEIIRSDSDSVTEKEYLEEFNRSILYFKKSGLLDCAWRLIASRKFIVENNLFFTFGIKHEDNEWVPKVLCMAQNIEIYDKPFYYYRKRNNSITSKRKLENLLDMLTVIKNLEQFLLGINECNKKEYLDFAIFSCLYTVAFYANYLTKSEKKKILNEVKTKKYIFKYSKKVNIFICLFGISKGVTFYSILMKLKKHLNNCWL